MPNRHSESAATSIAHGDATRLFPVEKLNAEVLQFRDAKRTLDTVDNKNVVVVAPTGLGSSYFLTQHPLTTIAIETLAPTIQNKLADALETPITQFEVIQIGRWTTNSPNHSLREYVEG